MRPTFTPALADPKFELCTCSDAGHIFSNHNSPGKEMKVTLNGGVCICSRECVIEKSLSFVHILVCVSVLRLKHVFGIAKRN